MSERGLDSIMSGCGGCSFQGESTAVEHAFVGVRFEEEANLTLCASDGRSFARGDRVMVDLGGEPSLGQVEKAPMPVFKPCQKSSARKILRPASDDDVKAQERKLERDRAARRFVQERSRALDLEMKVSKVDFALSGKKATVYFTAEHRVDFRRLVRETAQRFGTRVHMQQVGTRDEARLLSGLGVCGRSLCCSTWLRQFRPISISMAKRQSLSLNPSKISGQCGRLLCCLAYEDDQYGSGRRKAKRPEAPPAGAT